MSPPTKCSRRTNSVLKWWPWRDLNPHAVLRQPILNRPRLPFHHRASRTPSWPTSAFAPTADMVRGLAGGRAPASSQAGRVVGAGERSRTSTGLVTHEFLRLARLLLRHTRTFVFGGAPRRNRTRVSRLQNGGSAFELVVRGEPGGT